MTQATRKLATPAKATPAKATPAKATPAKTTTAKKPRVPKALVPLSNVSVGTFASRTELANHRPGKDRDADQQQVDKIVAQAYQRWIDAGRPTEWMDSQDAALWIEVSTPEVETLTTRIRRGGNHLKLKIRFGKETKNGSMTRLAFIASEPDRNASTDESNASEDAEPAGPEGEESKNVSPPDDDASTTPSSESTENDGTTQTKSI
jgi:hypothetical protein